MRKVPGDCSTCSTKAMKAAALPPAGANPHLPIDAVRSMLLAHSDHHVQQIQQLQGKQSADEAQTRIARKNHMYGVADALTGVIAQQYPAKFK